MTQKGTPEWVCFDDWVKGKLSRREDWTTVVHFDPIGSDRDKCFRQIISTYSFLLVNHKESILGEMAADRWEVQPEFGYGYQDTAEQGVCWIENAVDEEKSAFLTYCKQIGEFPPSWELSPAFMHYFDLRSRVSGELQDPYNGEVVAKLLISDEVESVLVRTDYLQDYLAARQMVLIRQHDHKRFWTEPIPLVPENETTGQVRKTNWGCYRLIIVNSHADSGFYCSRLVAKDLVLPATRSGIVGGRSRARPSGDDYPEFITQAGVDGEEVKQKPNPDDILHPAWFNPLVLKKYYDSPSKYTVDFGSPGLGTISFLDQWSIPLGRNAEGIIVLWLGDLAKQRLPLLEIKHWLAHNIRPRGGMASDFWNAQMMCQFIDTPSLEHRLRVARRLIKKAVKQRGVPIYRDYEGPHRYLEKRLRIPITDEHAEFSECILVLAQMFIDHLDSDTIYKQLDPEQRVDGDSKKPPPYVTFALWLEHKMNVRPVTAENIKKALQNLQKVRSQAGVAHGFSHSGYGRVLRRLDLSEPINAQRLFLAVAEPIAAALESLCTEFGVASELTWLSDESPDPD